MIEKEKRKKKKETKGSARSFLAFIFLRKYKRGKDKGKIRRNVLFLYAQNNYFLDVIEAI